MTQFTKIQIRNGTYEEWIYSNPILALGEPGFESDTNRFKVGDGQTSWNNLGYMDCCPPTPSPTPPGFTYPPTPTPTVTPPGFTYPPTPTPTVTPTLEVNTLFVLWENCYPTLEQIPNQFGCFDICGSESVCKSVHYYFQNSFSEQNNRSPDFIPYNENYSFVCDVIDGNTTIVLRVEKGNGIKLNFNKCENVCYCTPTPTPTIT